MDEADKSEFRLFIVHSPADLEWAKQLQSRLSQDGVSAALENHLPGTHSLGMLVQLRGEYDQALDYYRQSLAIFEELGNRAGLASGYGQLGVLYTETGEVAEAVPYSLYSLAIHAELRLPAIATALHWLGRQRQVLGEQEFAAILSRRLDPVSAATVLGWFDQINDQ